MSASKLSERKRYRRSLCLYVFRLGRPPSATMDYAVLLYMKSTGRSVCDWTRTWPKDGRISSLSLGVLILSAGRQTGYNRTWSLKRGHVTDTTVTPYGLTYTTAAKRGLKHEPPGDLDISGRKLLSQSIARRSGRLLTARWSCLVNSGRLMDGLREADDMNVAKNRRRRRKQTEQLTF